MKLDYKVLLKRICKTQHALAGVTLVFALLATAGGAYGIRACNQADPGERERCKAERRAEWARRIRLAADRMELHLTIVNAIERIQCYRETGDVKVCHGIFKASPFPAPDPYHREVIQSMQPKERERLQNELREDLKKRHLQELKYINNLFGGN